MARSVEKSFVGIFLLLVLAAMFLLIGEPGVDWVLVAPVFILLSRVGPISLLIQRLRKKTVLAISFGNGDSETH